MARAVSGGTKVVWLTYAWEDNQDGDIDFVAQELSRSGLTVKVDRWNLRAGLRLWEHTAEHISNPQLSRAWLEGNKNVHCVERRAVVERRDMGMAGAAT